ncbi:hypothetical protein JCM8097_001821 [Rhodosporidiobolus ruineniae]
MGVHGLWQLVSPCARPIQLETLNGKRLAIDASIWLYQFQMAMRDKKTGDTLQGAHIMGTFRRIMKLLFHGIKPVFVFDGDAPMLKKRTIEKRRRKREGAGRDLAKTAQQLLAAQLRGVVAEKELNRRRKKALEKQANGGAEGVDTGDQIGEDAVYLEDLDKPAAPAARASPAKPRKDALRDDYALPKIDGPLESRAKASDPRIATEEELREFIEDLRPEDLDITSPFFGNLPTEVKYEILGDLRIKTRQVNHQRVKQMRDLGTAVDFSRAQIDNLMERNTYTQRLLDVTDELGRAAIQIPTRVAGQRNREYVLVKQDVGQGGGWALGVKNVEEISKEPIVLDTTTDESVGTHTDTDEFEEVGVDSTPEKKTGLPTPDLSARRLLAVEAVRARAYASSSSSRPAADPYLDLPAALSASSRRSGKKSLFTGVREAAEEEEEEDAALQRALYESAQAAAGSPELARLPLPPAQPVPGPSSSRLPALQPAPPPTPASATTGTAAHAMDTDDEMEYVDLPPAGKDKGKGKAVEPVQQQQEPIVLDGTDEEDAFEEVDVAAPSRLAAAKPPSRPPSRHASTAPPPRPPSLASRPPSRPCSPSPALDEPTPPPISRSIFDSVLPSDSEGSDAEHPSPRRRAPASPAKPPQQPQYGRGSPTPDPFELVEAELAAGLRPKEVDFAFEAAPPAGRAAPSPSPQLPTPPPLRTSAAAAAPSARSPSPPTPAPTTPAHAPASPSGLPLHLPPLEKAREAVDAEEAAVVPQSAEVEEVLPPEFQQDAAVEPREPTPTEEQQVGGETDEEMEMEEVQTAGVVADKGKRKDVEAAPPAAAEVVAYFDDLDNPSAAAPVPPTSSAAAPAAEAPANASEPEEFFSDWSRSPSPLPGARQAEGTSLFRPADPDDEEMEDYNSDAAAEEAAEALRAEEGMFADVVAALGGKDEELRNERLEKMRAEAERDVARLDGEKRAAQKNADGVTRQMAMDIKELLILFGIPYIDAPGEAEAECAALQARQLVDGIVTDDSDVFLFGGSRIYRNMFNEKKYVECYLLQDLEREVGLDRDKLVRLAYLLGSDYTEGLPGIGPVLGMELLEEFPGEEGLKKFRQWWSRVQSGKDKGETNTKWRRAFRKRHQKLIIDQSWPAPEVAQAYYRPTVEESDESFQWGGVDLDGLRMYLARTLGWDQPKADGVLVPLIKRDKERREKGLAQQKQVTDFFDYSAGYQPSWRQKQPKFASKRLQNVVQNWKDKNQKKDDKAVEEDGEEEVEVEQPAKKKRKASTAKSKPPPKKLKAKKSTPASRKRAAKAARDARAAANGGVYSSEEDLDADVDFEARDQTGGEDEEGREKKGKKRTQPARKKRKSKAVVPSETDEE